MPTVIREIAFFKPGHVWRLDTFHPPDGYERQGIHRNEGRAGSGLLVAGLAFAGHDYRLRQFRQSGSDHTA